MKKINYLLIIIASLFISNTVFAAAPKVSDNLDYSSCASFADVFKTIGIDEGSYYYKYCYRATCSNGVYVKSNMTFNSAYRCQNGNGTPYTKVEGDACSKYEGTCNTKNSIYCTKVLYVDCNRTSDGKTYESQNPVTPTTKITTTTKKITTTKSVRTTTKSVQTTTKYIIPESTTTSIIIDPRLSSTNLTYLKVNDTELPYDNTVDTYHIELPFGVKNVDISYGTEADTTTVDVVGNNDMPDEDHSIILNIASSNGTTRTITINVSRYYVASNDCSLSNLTVEGYNLKFKKNVKNFKLTIKKGTKELKVIPSLNSAVANYEIEGNTDINKNATVRINVTAEDGTKCEYTIKVQEASDAWKYIILIILIIGGLAGVGYLLYTTLMKAKGKYRYE